MLCPILANDPNKRAQKFDKKQVQITGMYAHSRAHPIACQCP
jgi:hypothetical protein